MLGAGRGGAVPARGPGRPSSACKDDGYQLSDAQAQAILELRLQRLTGLEQDKIRDEYREVMDDDRRPARHPRQARRASPQIIARRARRDAATQFGDKRRSEIVTVAEDISIEDLIAPQDMVVTLLARRLHQVAAARRLPRAEARRPRQARRPRRRKTTSSSACSSRTRTTTCCASPTAAASTGSRSTRCRRAARTARGKPIVNLFPLDGGREDHRDPAGEGVRREPLRVHGDRAGHGEEDAARRVLAPAAVAASSPSTWTRATT